MLTISGGYIKPIGTWRNAATGQVNPIWLAHSNETGGEIEAYSIGLARYWVETIHERFEGMRRRTGQSKEWQQ